MFLPIERTVRVNIEIMCAFVQLHQVFLEHIELTESLGDTEKEYYANFKIVFDATRHLEV